MTRLTKKVMVVIPSSGFGGAEKILINVAEFLSKKNVVHLVVVTGNEDKGHQVNQDIFHEVTYLKAQSVFKSFFKLSKQMKNFHPDFILSTTLNLNVLVLLLKFVNVSSYKVVVRESSVVTSRMKFANKTGKLFTYIMPFFYNNFAYKIICQSNDIKVDLRKNFNIDERKLVQIPNFVEELPMNNKKIEGRLDLLFVGRLSQVKGIDRLVEIIKGIKRKCRLVVLGEGNQKVLIESIVESCSGIVEIFCVGNVLGEEKIQYFKKADLYLQTSYVEGFPNATLEASAMGIPTLAFDVPGGTKEIITKESGYLISDGDIKQFIDVIEGFNSKEFNKKEIVKDVYSRYSKGVIMEKYENLFS